MQARLHIFGKCTRESLMTGSESQKISHRLYIRDRSSGTEYLVGTGSDVSVFPKEWSRNETPKIGHTLQAANGSIIQTYGKRLLSLNLGLHRDFLWHFIIADVTKPIIGAHFLNHFDLLVDLKRKCLLNGLNITCNNCPSNGYEFHSSIQNRCNISQITTKISIKSKPRCRN